MIKKVLTSICIGVLASPLAYSSEPYEVNLKGTYKPATDSGQTLKQTLDGFSAGTYRLSPNAIISAVQYQPVEGEPTVIDLVNTYLVRGQEARFWTEVKGLSDRGNPNAIALYGAHLVDSNDGSGPKGVRLLKRASLMGRTLADNALGLRAYLSNQKDKLSDAEFSLGARLAHGATNLAESLEYTSGQECARLIYVRSAETGCASGALRLGMLYEETNPVEAAKWHLINLLRGSVSFDRYEGVAYTFDYLMGAQLTQVELNSAHSQAMEWLGSHYPILDGFDHLRQDVSPPCKSPEEAIEDGQTVQDLFWSLYAKGRKKEFAKAIEELDAGDANVLYMKAFLAQGYIGAPNYKKRLEYLGKACNQSHPLAMQDMAMERFIQGLLVADNSLRLSHFSSAFNLLRAAHIKWREKAPEAIGDLTALLGYFYLKGWGTWKNSDLAYAHFEEAMPYSAVAMTFMSRKVEDPALKVALLTFSKGESTTGDWMSGSYDWQQAVKGCFQEDKIKGVVAAKELEFLFPNVSHTIYQKLSLGIQPKFAVRK